MTLQLPVETRVTNLEELMAQLTQNVNQLSYEMRDFKDEMREFKDEMTEFKDEMREFKNTSQREMREFKDEMREHREKTEREINAYREQSEREIRAQREKTDREIMQMRKQWGELSNRLGTMAEDLVAPSIGRILRTVVGCPEDRVEYVAVRVRRRRAGDNHLREFDVVAICGDYILINETKSRLRPEDIAAFAYSLPDMRTYFPEYREHKLIGAIASLYVDESLVRHGERLGLIVLGFGEDVMDVLNSPDFQLKTF